MSDISPYQAVERLIQEAERIQGAARNNARAMGTLLVGHLRRLDTSTLKKLKREIAAFNMTTGSWGER